ncbi:MAG: CHAT domain-containing protein [Bacteroidota bacterium]
MKPYLILLACLMVNSLALPAQQNFQYADSLLDVGEYEEALKIGLALRAQGKSTENAELLIDAHYLIGYSYEALGKRGEFSQFEEEIRPLLRSDHPHVVDIMLILGNAERILGNTYDAFQYYRAASNRINKDFSEENGDLLLDALINLGVITVQMNDYEAGISYYQYALPLIDSLSNPEDAYYYNSLKRIVYANLGKAYFLSEQKEHSLHAFEAALEPALQTSAKETIRNQLSYSITLVYFEEYQKAEQLLQEVLAKKKIRKFDKGRAFRSLAEIRLASGQAEEAIALLDSAEVYYTTAKKLNTFWGVLNLLKGKAYSQITQPDSANQYFQRSLTRLIWNFDPIHPDELPRSPSLGNGRYVFECLLEKARNYRAQSKDELAYHTFDFALGLMDTLRSNLSSTNAKYFWGEEVQQALEEGIEVSLELYRQTQEPIWKERTYQMVWTQKAFSLKEQLRELHIRNQVDIPDSLRNKEVSLGLKIGKLKQRLTENPPDSLLASLQTELFHLQDEMRKSRESLDEMYPQLMQSYQATSLDLKSIQHRIRPEEAIWEFFWGGNQVLAFVLTQDGIQCFELGDPEKVEKSIKPFLKRLRDPQWVQEYAFRKDGKKEFGKYAYGVFRLLEPMYQNWTRLKIIPDGLLTSIPFECLLISKPKEEEDYDAFDWLVNHASISYDYALDIPVATTQPGKKLTYLGIAPAYAHEFPPSLTRGSTFRGSFSPLVYNKEEVERGARIFGGESLIGPDGDKASFLKVYQGANIIHMALHAFVNDTFPAYSGLAFAQEGKQIAQGEILYAYEVPTLNLQADLTLLSACQSGVGYYQAGEGVMSLGRNFMEAGSRSVAMTHWSVDDEASALLATAFLQYLKEGLSKDDALKQAKKDYLSGQDKNHPYFWGSFVLMGDVAPLSHPTNRTFWLIIIILASTLFLLGLRYFIGRRS